MISKEQHAAALKAMDDLMVLGEIAERLGDVGCAHDTDEVPATWISWFGTRANEAAQRLALALAKEP